MVSNSGPTDRSAAAAAASDSDATVISSRSPSGPASMAELGRTLEGRRLGAYVLEQFVGGGGMGAVFRAVDTTLDRVVAVKVLAHQQSNDEEMLRRFRNEAQSAARLDHENIGRVYAVGAEDGWHFIVFEFIEGTNLRDVISEGGVFGLARTINVAIQIADALEHASERSVVHRDIKPSNIIITPAGRARLVDMGLARLHHVAGDNDLTVSGMTLGTFDYISPEQARDPRLADVRSDLYSLGCTIFYMLAGRAPFADGTMVQKLLKHQQAAPPAIDELRPDVPRRFAAVLDRLMAKDPEDRPQRPAELIAELLEIADEEGIEVALSSPATMAAVEAVEAVAETPPPARATSWLQWLPWLVPLLALAAIVVGLTGLPAGSRATATRPALRGPLVGADLDGPGREPAAPWRVVDVPSGERDTATVGAAVRQAADGDLIELAYDGFRDELPIVIRGRGLRIRAAAGHAPGIRLGAAPNDAAVSPAGVNDLPKTPAEIGQDFGWTIVSGTLAIEGVRLRVAPTAAGQNRAFAAFSLGDRSLLSCDAVVAEFPSQRDVSTESGDPGTPAHTPAVFIRVGTAATDDSDATEPDCTADVRITRSSLTGDGLAFEAAAAGRLGIVWSEGRCITPRRFLVAEGGRTGGKRIQISLSRATIACGEGFACLLDSSPRPAAPELRCFAEECRFAVPVGQALILQSGVDEADRYRGMIEWLDANSRYEGSVVFRRIDSATERVEMDFAAAPQPLVHASRISADLEGWPGDVGDAGRRGDSAAETPAVR